jgi:hypothetical protein
LKKAGILYLSKTPNKKEWIMETRRSMKMMVSTKMRSVSDWEKSIEKYIKKNPYSAEKYPPKATKGTKAKQ